MFFVAGTLSLCLVYYQPSAPRRWCIRLYTSLFKFACSQTDVLIFQATFSPPTAKKKTKERKRDKKKRKKKKKKKSGPGKLGGTSCRLSRGHRCTLFPTDNCPPLCNARSPESANPEPTFVSASVCPCGLCQLSCLEQ